MVHQYLAITRIIVADAHLYDYNKFAGRFPDTWYFVSTGIDERIANVFIATQEAAQLARLPEEE